MPAALEAALAQPGLGLLVLAALLGGMARGFTGFGTGLVFMPIAGLVLAPAQAVAVIVLMDLAGTLPSLPRAARAGRPREIGMLGLGMLAGVPAGIWALTVLPVEAFRWSVSLMALATVAALAAGWRWRGGRGPGMRVVVGGLSGLVGGATALAGPPVILYYMASPLPVAIVRANLLMFLSLVGVMMLALLALRGVLAGPELVLAAVLAVPFVAGARFGTALFRPDRAGLYRITAYLMIAGSALVGLPLWQGGS